MRILVDFREDALFQNLIKKDFTIEKANLEIGDIVFEDDDGQILLIIERKTVDDLLSSIKDGRYTEQSFRLNALEQIHNHNIYYLIEGNIFNQAIVFSTLFS